jgi:hypothetical protein
MSAWVQKFCSNCDTASTECVHLQPCAKCRQVVYCDVECQRAHWETHRTTCKPCAAYAFQQVILGETTNNWRKTLKWLDFFEEMMKRDEPDGHKIDEMRHVVLRAFIQAYEEATEETQELHYASDAIPLIHEQIAMCNKSGCIDRECVAILELGKFIGMSLDDECDEQVIACYQRVLDIGTTCANPFLMYNGYLSLGRVARTQMRNMDAADLFRAAVDAAQLLNDSNSNIDAIIEMDCLGDLIEVLLDINAYDEVEPLVLRFSSVLRTVMRSSPEGHISEQLNAHFYLACVHNARGRHRKVAREVRALISLADENKDAMLAWPHLMRIILQGVIDFMMARQGGEWDKDIFVLVCRAVDTYGVDVNGI